jgi:ketosteroid isomerase-like protein
MMTVEEILEHIRASFEGRHYDGFVDLFAKDGIYELPYALRGAQSIYSGIDAIRTKFSEIANSPVNRIYDLHKVNLKSKILAGGEGAVLEFSIKGRLKATSTEIKVASSMAVIEVLDGKITRYRDYPNSIGIAESMGLLSQFVASLTQ